MNSVFCNQDIFSREMRSNKIKGDLDSKERLSRSDGYGSTSEPIADKTSGRAYQIFRRRGDGAVCGSF